MNIKCHKSKGTLKMKKKKKNNAGELETNPAALSALPLNKAFQREISKPLKEMLKTH